MRKFLSVLLTVLILTALCVPCADAAGNAVAVTSKAGGTKNYSSMTVAAEMVKDGDTITLLNDVTEYVVLSAKDMELTLDGNGMTIFGNLEINAAGGSVTVKNLTVDANKTTETGLFLDPAAADKRGTVLLSDVTVTTKDIAKDAIDSSSYNDLTVENCNVHSGVSGISAVPGTVGAKVTVRNTTVFTEKGYCFYGRNGGEYLLEDCNFTPKGYAAVQIAGAASEELGSALTVNNCTIQADGQYCFAILAYDTLEINGGTYHTTNKFTNIYMNGNGSHIVINDGVFTNNGQADGAYDTCTVLDASSKDAGSTLDILGGTFTYDSASIPGAVVRAACKAEAGKVNIYGGTFRSSSTLPIIDGGLEQSEVNIFGGTFENIGSGDINAYTKVGAAGSETIPFPAGSKTVTVGAAPVESEEPAPATDPTPAVTDAPVVDTPDNPKTGDPSNVYAVCVILAVLGCAVILGTKKIRQ